MGKYQMMQLSFAKRAVSYQLDKINRKESIDTECGVLCHIWLNYTDQDKKTINRQHCRGGITTAYNN